LDGTPNGNWIKKFPGKLKGRVYEGYARSFLSNGISVNATLIFSPNQARKCLDFMKKGIDEFENTGERELKL